MLGTRSLKLGEIRIFSIDLSKWLLSGDTVETVNVVQATVTPVTVPPLVAEADKVDDQTVSVRVSGGAAGNFYTVKVTTTTLVDQPDPLPDTSQKRVDCIGIDMTEACS